MGIGGSHGGRCGRSSGGGPDAEPPQAPAPPPEPPWLEPPAGAPARSSAPPSAAAPPVSPPTLGFVVLSPPHARATAPTKKKLESTCLMAWPSDPPDPQRARDLPRIAKAMLPSSEWAPWNRAQGAMSFAVAL